MKKIFILVLGILMSVIYANNLSVDASELKQDSHLERIGSDSNNNFVDTGKDPAGGSNGNNAVFIIETNDEDKVYKLGSSSTDIYNVLSTRNQVMGAVSIEFEYYSFGIGDNNTRNIMVLYKSTIEPKDDVKYANGFGNLFTETGDAAAEYFKINVEFGTETGICLYKDSEPKTTVISYENSISISYQYLTDSNGYLYVLPIFTYSQTAKYESIIVENSSSKSDNCVNIKHTYTANDTYSMASTEQFGCFYFTIPDSLSSISMRINYGAEFTIAEGGKYGECRNSMSATHVHQLAIF